LAESPPLTTLQGSSPESLSSYSSLPIPEPHHTDSTSGCPLNAKFVYAPGFGYFLLISMCTCTVRHIAAYQGWKIGSKKLFFFGF